MDQLPIELAREDRVLSLLRIMLTVIDLSSAMMWQPVFFVLDDSQVGTL
jgi:hypothetical protein